MKNLNLLLAAAAGLIGGIAGQQLLLPVQAQTAPPKVIVAQSFALADEAGHVVGVFAIKGGAASQRGSMMTLAEPQHIVLYDADGKEIWSASPQLKPAVQ